MERSSVEPGLMLARFEANGTVTPAELERLVHAFRVSRLLRKAQQAYGKNHLNSDLAEARRLEAKLDDLLYSPPPVAYTPDLFAGELGSEAFGA